jgi:NAD(P)-dependent dehydrogenase (short-subunit alcohol dehydrogenase family)
MSLIAIVTGASSGFGRMIAHDLAHAGHKIYASMRDTTGRNADKVAENAAYAARHDIDLPSDAAAVSFAVIDRVRGEFLHRIGHADLLHPSKATGLRQH